jgi:hypothetical protein
MPNRDRRGARITTAVLHFLAALVLPPLAWVLADIGAGLGGLAGGGHGGAHAPIGMEKIVPSLIDGGFIAAWLLVIGISVLWWRLLAFWLLLAEVPVVVAFVAVTSQLYEKASIVPLVLFLAWPLTLAWLASTCGAAFFFRQPAASIAVSTVR